MKRYNIGCLAMLNMCLTPIAEDGGSAIAGVNPEPVEVEAEDETPVEVVVGEVNGLKFGKQEFKVSRNGDETPITGFGFATPLFESPEQFIAYYDALCKAQGKADMNGSKLILDLAQTALEGKLRIRVKAGTPKVGDAGYPTQTEVANWYDAQAKDNEHKLLFSVKEASNWIPGIRELSKSKQRDAKLLSIKELIAKAMATGKTQEEAVNVPEIQAALFELATKFI